MKLRLKLYNLKETMSKKLACNIKTTAKVLCACVRSKQNVRDKVGPLEDSAGIIISQGFSNTEDLNGYFSSAFSIEDVNSLPVPDRNFRRRNRSI